MLGLTEMLVCNLLCLFKVFIFSIEQFCICSFDNCFYSLIIYFCFKRFFTTYTEFSCLFMILSFLKIWTCFSSFSRYFVSFADFLTPAISFWFSAFSIFSLKTSYLWSKFMSLICHSYSLSLIPVSTFAIILYFLAFFS